MFKAGINDNVPDTVTFDLRWYPDDADCLDAGDGFLILDRIVCVGISEVQQPAPIIYPQPIECPAGGWIVVYGLGGAANCMGHVTLQGFDM